MTRSERVTGPAVDGERSADLASRLARANTPFAQAIQRLNVAVRRLRGADTQWPDELSHSQYELLSALAEHGTMATIELAEVADIAGSTAVVMLHRLAEAGWVERVRATDDRRRVHVKLTPAGERVVWERYEQYAALFATALRGLRREELEHATIVLERVATVYEQLLAQSLVRARMAGRKQAGK